MLICCCCRSAAVAAPVSRYLYLGTFNKEQEAAQVWDLVAIKSRGTSTATNFPVGGYLNADGSVVHHARYDKMISNRQAKRSSVK
jgi:hypothetical protein